jgi:hypothetical protein
MALLVGLGVTAMHDQCAQMTRITAAHYEKALRIQALAQPITFDYEGLQNYFERFNSRHYTQLLSCSMDHLSCDFLPYALQTKAPLQFAATACDIITARMKACAWVNGHAVHEALLRATPVITELVSMQEDNSPDEAAIQVAIQQIVMRCSDEQELIQELTQAVADYLRSAREETPAQVLCQAYYRFTQTALDKAIWSPRDQIGSWNAFKNILHDIAHIGRLGLVNEVELNMLEWAAIYRFCYFIEQTGKELAIDTYTTIKDELATQSLPLSYDDDEDMIMNKQERLLNAILQGELQARAATYAAYTSTAYKK